MLKFYSKRKKRAQPEARLQKVICSHLLMNGAFFFSIPNEAERSPMMAAHLKAMGMRPGCADLCVIVKGMAHFMEVKSEKGVSTDAQRQFSLLCFTQDIPYVVVNNISDALKTLSLWGAIKPSRIAA